MTEEVTEDSPPPEVRQNLDISLLMLHIERLKTLLGPVVYTTRFIAEIRRWEYGYFYMGLLLLANNSVLILPLSVTFVLWFSFIVLVATLGYIHSATNILVKVLPSTSEESSTDLQDHRVLIHNYRDFLFDLDDWVLSANKKLTVFYRLIKWDDNFLSIRFYLAVISVIGVLHVITTTCAFVLLVNAFLLHHKILQVINSRQKNLAETNGSLSEDSQQQQFEELPTAQQILNMQYDPLLGSASDLENDSDDEAESDNGADISCLDKEEILRLGEDYEREIKKVTATGTCVKCGAVFTSLLKRRRLCSHCGNHFCSKCCSHKVPRSLFGATSPAAQTETVQVCEYCYMFLTGEKEKDT